MKQGDEASTNQSAQVTGQLFGKKSGLKNSCHRVDGVEKTVLEFKAQLIAAKQAQDGKFCGGSLKTYSR
ncbi:MAG: hypothetical protein K2X75_02865 [Burkholderiaceae bacterium]|nr:hypothetical protein [Burkholderiaceae bacterium]